MPALAAPKKLAKPNAPKKPTAKSKTGRAECSEAASNWQLSLRGKATLREDTYATLGKCRSLSRGGKQAESQGRTGQLSAQGEAAAKARLQSRFDRNLITKESRKKRLTELLAKRAEKKASASTKQEAKPVEQPQPNKLTDIKATIGKIKKRNEIRAEITSGASTLKTSAIQADPDRFQYKMNTSGPVGVTDQFRETKVWNKELAGVVQVWKDSGDGKTYVVNGHHRYELAKRLGVRNLNVQYIQAKDALEARTKGALTNIAEGRGTSIDAAKFFRDKPEVSDWTSELKAKGISLSERTAREGLALKDVAPKIWTDVVNEMTPVSRAVAIGSSKLRHEDQLNIYRKSQDGNWTSTKTAEFATELKNAPLVKVSTGGLFADDEYVNTAEQRAALAERLKKNLSSSKKLFATVSRTRNAGKLESGGNVINRESSQAIAEANERALMTFDITRKYGRVSKTLDEYATRITKGEKFDKAYDRFQSVIQRRLRQELEMDQIQKRLKNRASRLAAR